MRKYIFILLSIVALGFAQSCSERLDVPDNGTAEGETCLNFSVTVPEQGTATRALAEHLTSLWVLVFDSNDFFVEAKEATPVDPNAFSTDTNTEYKFSVTLQASPSKRTLHLVANYDFKADPPQYNHEYYIMSHLTKKIGEEHSEAYWQKIVLENGIPVDINKFSDADKEKIVKIPLVRNFAKVTVKSTTDKFELEGFALWNVPDRGSVAPCVMMASDFAAYIDETSKNGLNPWVSRSYDELSSSYDGTSTTGFEGFLPADVVIDKHYPKDSEFTSDEAFMFERPYSGDDTNTAIIVKGKFKGDGASGNSTYFKIDFVKDVDPTSGFNVYYNILRNFLYSVNIKSCTSDGYASAQEAATAPSMNNFIFSVDTQDYTNISDNEHRIFVEYTEKTIVSDAEDFTFKLKYLPDVSKPTETNITSIKVCDKDTKVQLPVGHPDGGESYTFTVDQSPVVKSVKISTTDADGWTTFILTPQEMPESGERTQSVVYYVTDPEDETGKTLLVARTVIFHLRKPSEMKVNIGKSDTGIPTAASAEFLMNLYIPSGLNKSVFPLEFRIESANNNLTPDTSEKNYNNGYMSTWYGASVTGSGKQTFGFTKSITYTEYLALDSDEGKSYKILPCAFKTTKKTTSGTNKVYISNPYFTPDPTVYSVEK